MSIPLEEAFARGLLIRPGDRHHNLVHLVRAIASLAGVGNVPGANQPGPVHELIDLIGPADHIVFVLLDGLGMNLVRRLPRSTLIASSLKKQLRSTCPSTTACALTSVATGQYATQHAVTGWFCHLEERGISSMILPFVERISGRPLPELGLQPEDVLPMPPLAPRMTHRPLTLVPAGIANTPYNRYTRGGTAGGGYRSFSDAAEYILEHVATGGGAGAGGATYSHLYLPEVDSACHKLGVNHPDVLPLVMEIDTALQQLAEGLDGRARLIVSADHGLIDVPEPQQTLLLEGDPMLDLLRVPPSGDGRMPIFHVRPDRHADFVEMFLHRFGNVMSLVSIDEAERLELFGPGTFSPLARGRFGDFIAFPYRPASLAYHPPNRPLGHLYLAVHAGLSPEEMWVPLCIA